MRVKAWVGKEDGKVTAIFGYAMHPNCIEVFSECDPSALSHKKTLVKWAKIAVAEARSRGRTVIATLDPDIGSPKFLEHLGFYQEENYWRL